MLKIKECVDIKELEKFGFEEFQFYYYKRLNNCAEIYISKKDLEIHINILHIDIYETFCDLDFLYDLIQAGLVEKVVEAK